MTLAEVLVEGVNNAVVYTVIFLLAALVGAFIGRGGR